MGRIKQLNQHTINQISAGEVIERPASVVKELVENSIDAGATRVSIEISNECRNIRVADNGCGIHPDDVVLAFSKHATSKISSGEDLYNINTLGFRGEALASIISIAKLICITRTQEYDYGTKVVCENSEVEQSQTGCAIGTIMEIKDLFYNIPVRLKFLKSEKTEFAYISELVTAIAISHPEVAIELKNNGKTTLKTDGVNGLDSVIKTLFSKSIFSTLKPVTNDDLLSQISISGYASTPNYTRTSKKDYHIFVNNRTVKCPIFIKAIDMAYRNSLPNGKYPFVVLNLTIPAKDIDVNVHPTKKEVKYKNPNQIFNFIRTSVESALINSPQVYQKENIVSINEKVFSEPEKYNKTNDIIDRDSINIDKIMNAFDTINSSNQHSNVAVIEKTATNIPHTKPLIDFEQTKFISKSEVKQDTIIGQYKNTYILIEREEGLEIVDQHIADERYIYETLQTQKEPASQILFISDVLEVNDKEVEIIKSNLDKFAKFGYGIEFTGENEIIFRKIPQLLSKYSPKEILQDILDNIEGDINNLEEKILITTSCKSAVKANTPLNLFQMQEIIKNWRACKSPYTCPHGRPISKILKHNEIAGFFMRAE